MQTTSFLTPYQERYNALKAEGKCVSCKHREPMPERVQCGLCAENQIERATALRQSRIDAGQCPHCGGEPLPGFRVCAKHRKRYAIRYQSELPRSNP